MSTSGRQTFSITRNLIWKHLYISQHLLENLSLKLFCIIIFPSLPGQYDNPCFTMASLQLVGYPWKHHFSNHIKFKLKISNYIPEHFKKFKFQVAVWRHFLLVARSIGLYLFYNGQFSFDDYHWHPNFSNHTKFKQKTLTSSQDFSKNLSLKLLSVNRSLPYSLLYHRYFLIIWLPLVAKLPTFY